MRALRAMHAGPTRGVRSPLRVMRSRACACCFADAYVCLQGRAGCGCAEGFCSAASAAGAAGTMLAMRYSAVREHVCAQRRAPARVFGQVHTEHARARAQGRAVTHARTHACAGVDCAEAEWKGRQGQACRRAWGPRARRGGRCPAPDGRAGVPRGGSARGTTPHARQLRARAAWPVACARGHRKRRHVYPRPPAAGVRGSCGGGAAASARCLGGGHTRRTRPRESKVSWGATCAREEVVSGKCLARPAAFAAR